MSMVPMEEALEEGAQQTVLHPQQFQHHISQVQPGSDKDEPFRVMNMVGVRRY